MRFDVWVSFWINNNKRHLKCVEHFRCLFLVSKTRRAGVGE